MILMLVAGIVFLLAGLASIVYGVPVKEFSFGNTLILSGVIGGCTGAILIGLYAVGRQIRALAAGMGAASGVQRSGSASRGAIPSASLSEPDDKEAPLFPGDRAEPEIAPPAEPRAGRGSATQSATPWQDDPPRDQSRQRPSEAPPAPPAAEPAPKKRNLLFASMTRRERERAADAAGEGDGSATPTTTVRNFEEAWPQPDRARDEAGGRKRRSLLGTGDSATESPAEHPERQRLEPTPAPRSEEMTEVTVLKSGVVDGMAYSLYSDGSIEAQMPEGMMRFESIDALREHLDQRS